MRATQNKVEYLKIKNKMEIFILYLKLFQLYESHS